ncbi:MAG: helix-turn-helix domain-containing protein [Allosphingosinicella sp.]|uniref:helix-turn-helix domain-containing protein n=1 Tax=Allosphingosinicella sp. TaxID=2823234 RepID=UPI00392C302F
MAEAEYDYESGGNSVGQRLREAREARGLSLEEVAAQTRIPIRHLRSIEDGKYEELPALTYTVGFGRNYANAVGLDGAEIGRELRDQLGGAQRGSTISTEYYAPPDPARVPSRPLAWIAGVLALVLIAGYLIWRSQLGSADEAAEAPAVQQQAPQPQPQQQQPPAQQQPASLAGQPVTLTATGQVWLRVYEEGGASIVERTLQAGETYQVPATATRPMLRVGAPEALRVTVGQTAIPQLGPSGQPVGGVSLRPEDLAQRLQQPAPAGAAPAPQPGAPTRP